MSRGRVDVRIDLRRPRLRHLVLGHPRRQTVMLLFANILSAGMTLPLLARVVEEAVRDLG